MKLKLLHKQYLNKYNLHTILFCNYLFCCSLITQLVIRHDSETGRVQKVEVGLLHWNSCGRNEESMKNLKIVSWARIEPGTSQIQITILEDLLQNIDSRLHAAHTIYELLVYST